MGDAKPNVLMVLVDQWPGPLLGAAEHPVIQTPTLDQIRPQWRAVHPRLFRNVRFAFLPGGR